MKRLEIEFVVTIVCAYFGYLIMQFLCPKCKEESGGHLCSTNECMKCYIRRHNPYTCPACGDECPREWNIGDRVYLFCLTCGYERFEHNDFSCEEVKV